MNSKDSLLKAARAREKRGKGEPRPSPQHPDRREPYLRLGAIAVFVRDQERSLRFYQDHLGFSRAFYAPFQSAGRTPAVTPPDGTAVLSLIAPNPVQKNTNSSAGPRKLFFAPRRRCKVRRMEQARGSPSPSTPGDKIT